MKTLQATAALLVFWVLLTGSLQPVDLGLGAALSLVFGAWAGRLLWRDDAPTLRPRQLLALGGYLFSLAVMIVAGAIQVAGVVLHPRMPIDPVVIRHRTRLRRPVSRVAFANSLTLTPGTYALDVDGEHFDIHCLSPRFAEWIRSGELERRIARVFEEG